MIEKYLHYLWDKKLIPFHKLEFTNFESFKILDYGTYNQFESGPDFFNATILLDQLIWVGNIEMHIRSSDWLKHKHHKDKAYNNVILHVVYENDLTINQFGFEIPTIELKSVIDWKHFNNYQINLKKASTILCGTQFKSVTDIHRIHFLEKSLYARLIRKTSSVSLREDPTSVAYFFYFVTKSFGAKTNQLPFEELAKRIDFYNLKAQKQKDQLAIIRSITDLFEQQAVNHSNRMNASSWKQGGVRPSNSPIRRINQFIQFFIYFDFNLDFCELTPQAIISCFKEKILNFPIAASLSFSDSFQNTILINGVVPFLFWLGNKHEHNDFIEKAIEILSILPAEKNSTLKKWKDFGVKPKNAAESQAYLEIFNEFCKNKKCLSCSIGQQLLAE
jgi:hypothetical protein